ncbi:hypothetical protein, partial [Bombiscardovia coagulans]
MQSYQGVRFAAVVPGGQWVSALSSSVRGVGTWVKHTWGSGVRGVRQLVAGVHGLLRPASDVGSRSIAMVVAADGTPVFDDNDRPGNDSSDHNGVVRVNDLVTYRVDYMVSGVHSENTTVVITLPKGLMLESLPAFCGQGSSVSPESAGEVRVPYTANSIDDLAEQTVSCNVGTKDGSTESFAISLKVSNAVHHDALLAPQSVVLKGDGLPDVGTDKPIPVVRVTSALKWDLTMNGIQTNENSGYTYGPRFAKCPQNNTRTCFYIAYSLAVYARSDGKGAMPAAEPIKVTDDLSPERLFPGLSPAQYARMNADKNKYGAVISDDDIWQSRSPGFVAPKDTDQWTHGKAVRDSGSMSWVQQGGPGTPAYISIANTDWSLKTVPRTDNSGNTISPGYAYAVFIPLQVYVPVDTVKDFGSFSNGTWSLQARNTYTNLEMKGFDNGDVLTSAGQPTYNDYRQLPLIVRVPGGFDAYFGGVPGDRLNTPGEIFMPWWSDCVAGLPGNGRIRSGENNASPGQRVISQVLLGGANSSLLTKVTHVSSVAWDSTKTQLTNMTINNQITNTLYGYPVHNKPVWVSGVLNDNSHYVDDYSRAPKLEVEYGTGAQPVSGSDSGVTNASVTWYSSPDLVPGNDPVKAAQGIYTAVNRVRTYLVVPEPVGIVGDKVYVSVSIGLTVAADDMPDGTFLPMWASDIQVNHETSKSDVLASGPGWVSSYDPVGHAGAPGDRLRLARARVGVDSGVRRAGVGGFVPQVAVTGGDRVQFRLRASLTSAGGADPVGHRVWLEDCLPASLEYVPSAGSGGGPVVVSSSMPVDAKRPACGPGETYLRWEFTGQLVNEQVPEVVFEARVSSAADDGTYVNSVVVWSDADQSMLAARTSSVAVRVDNIVGVAVDKRSLTPTVGVNRVGSAVLESNVWELSVRNSQPTSGGLSDVVLVDVLPVAGVAGSRFAGVALLRSVSVTRGGSSGVRVEYTVSADVPRDPRVGEPGSVRWCVEAEFGSVGCPVSVADSRAVRVSRAGVFASGEVLAARVVVDVAGDVVVNQGYARVGGLRDPVGPVSREQRVVGASVAGVVWW